MRVNMKTWKRHATRLLMMLTAILCVLPLMSSGLVSPQQADAATTTTVEDGCRTYYPAGTQINLATAAKDSDCWDSGMVSKTVNGVEYKFMGWTEDSSVPETMGADTYKSTWEGKVASKVTMSAPGKTVYAVWVGGVTLVYNVNNPTGTTAPTTPKGGAADYGGVIADSSGWKAGDLTKIKGYKFDGWTDTQNGSVYHDFTKPLYASVTTVYAHWTPISYTVHYDKNNTDATGSMTDQQMQFDQTTALSKNQYVENPKQPGKWQFLNWNTKTDGTGTAYSDQQQVKNLTSTPGGMVTMYAQWKRLQAHLRFDGNAPSGATVTGSYNPVAFNTYDPVTVPNGVKNSFKCKGYIFIGWNTKADRSGSWVKEGSQLTTTNKDITLYAQWRSFTNSGGMLPMTGNGEGGLTVDWPKLGGELAALTAITTAIILIRKRHPSVAPRHK